MSEQQQRRDFLAKCLGGIGLGVLGVDANKAAAVQSHIPGKPVLQSPLELREPGKLEGKTSFRLRTNGTPQETQLLRNDNAVFGVEQLLVEFNDEDPKRHWVGVSLFALDGQEKTGAEQYLWPRIVHEDNQPVVCDHEGVRIPFPVLECYHNVQFGARKVFLACEMPIELTGDFVLGAHLRENERVYRMHMTPESTHITTAPKGEKSPAPQVPWLEKDLNLADKSSWLMGHDHRRSLLQLYPSLHPSVSQWRSWLQG